MNYQELYVVCQIDDFNLKVMVNRYVNNQVQVLYKEVVDSEQFADNGVIINPEFVAKSLRAVIDKINQLFKIKVERVALNLPSNNLKIYQSQAMLDFKEINHQVTNSDINQVIEMTKNIVIETDEVICLTKPYNFKVDSQSFPNSLPLNSQGQIISVESLIYSLPQAIYDSQLAVLKAAECQLLSVTLDQFALVFNLNNFENLVLIDWGWNSTKVSLFSNSALYAINNIKIGFNQIAQTLMNKMRCSYSKAERYLTKVINVNSNYLSDLIVDKYFDTKTKRFVTLSKLDLQNTVRDMLDEIVEYVSAFLNEVTADSKIEIVFTGQTINLPGFNTYMKNFERLQNVSYLTNSTPGVDNYEWAALIGTTRYQHNLNLFNNILLTSISSSNKELFNNATETVTNEENINEYHSHLNLNYQYNDNK
ncbi:hypothetical protein [Spiroplasma platyhelix]|uniref:SHS2 domain-containing protein n=1 Tax=Spiroplasma platyhelix PALS-1 TaxID=1276218 RepID=A0A846TVZ0_9MOLU|nr:hypothetical protein [Spiroplasma platyhelix]MBE4703949.1 Cell division protein FtsA [Spiroplasma platyhelix PALS-1]NKE38322.1 hypothetical protein [Spiroplasma platyhelix PALS-1]UJB29207.1 cell division protein FtsA [Spiroplasma platyhelix PALS-1]